MQLLFDDLRLAEARHVHEDKMAPKPVEAVTLAHMEFLPVVLYETTVNDLATALCTFSHQIPAPGLTKQKIVSASHLG